jgi:hypothetical protein
MFPAYERGELLQLPNIVRFQEIERVFLEVDWVWSRQDMPRRSCTGPPRPISSPDSANLEFWAASSSPQPESNAIAQRHRSARRGISSHAASNLFFIMARFGLDLFATLLSPLRPCLFEHDRHLQHFLVDLPTIPTRDCIPSISTLPGL